MLLTSPYASLLSDFEPAYELSTCVITILVMGHSAQCTSLVRKFRTVGATPWVPQIPAGPGHPRIPGEEFHGLGGFLAAPAGPGHSISKMPRTSPYNPNFEHYVLKKMVYTPLLL